MERNRPKIEDMEGQIQHSHEHRGDTGKYGNIYKEEVEVWWPKEDQHELCLIPYLNKENSVFRLENPDFNMPFSDKVLSDRQGWAHKLTVLIHGNIGVNKDNVLCPRTLKKSCPICEERDRLIKEGVDSKTAQEQISALNPAKRAVYNVFVFDSAEEMKKGVQIWEAPHQSIEDTLSELYVDRRTGEKKYYTMPEEKWNVCFEKKGKGLNTEYRHVEILARRKEDEFSEKELMELYDMAYNIEEIIDIKSYDELKEMHFGLKKEEEKEKEKELEERPERTGRFRREEKEEPKKDEREIPEEYKDCFGVQNAELEKCEDCPKKVWEECYRKCEEARKPPERETGRRRDIGR